MLKFFALFLVEVFFRFSNLSSYLMYCFVLLIVLSFKSSFFMHELENFVEYPLLFALDFSLYKMVFVESSNFKTVPYSLTLCLF